MYTLELYDGTKIRGLQRINPVTFVKNGNDSSIYHKLDEYNLSFALLFNEEDDMLEDVFFECRRQNFSNDGKEIRFRIGKWQENKGGGKKK